MQVCEARRPALTQLPGSFFAFLSLPVRTGMAMRADCVSRELDHVSGF
jgi:hypothetical protein